MTRPTGRRPGWTPSTPTAPTGQVRTDTPAPDRPDLQPDGTWALDPAAGGPCRTWPLDASCSQLPADPATWNAVQCAAAETASEILWRLTAGRYGLCRETVRPCRPPRLFHGRRPGLDLNPALPGGQSWLRIGCHHPDPDLCGCGPVAQVPLPGPVFWQPPDTPPAPDGMPRCGITVTVDGLAVDETLLWLGNGDRLGRTDGGRWPVSQHLDRPLSQEGTFGISFWRGHPVPTGGRRAAAIFAAELVAACTGAACRITARVTEIQRQGVSYQIDPQSFLDEGRTGITEVDLWVVAANPYRHRSPAAVYSPDLPGPVSVATTGVYTPDSTP